jgi:hypothetical protein
MANYQNAVPLRDLIETFIQTKLSEDLKQYEMLEAGLITEQQEEL